LAHLSLHAARSRAIWDPNVDENEAKTMVGQLLRWTQYKDVYHTYSSVASAIVYPHEGGYHWEVFMGDEVGWHGQVATLETAINHVEGNFIGRNLRTDLARFKILKPPSAARPARGEEANPPLGASQGTPRLLKRTTFF
jgi:hypothetical protein